MNHFVDIVYLVSIKIVLLLIKIKNILMLASKIDSGILVLWVIITGVGE